MQKAIRVSALVIVIGFLVSLVVFNAIAQKAGDMEVWNDKMAKGDATTAKHHFIMYTDIFCPYCDKFSDAVAANLEDFEKTYVEDKEILFEIRVTDVNYVNGHSENSRPAGLAAYCAAKQGDFWSYYYALLGKIFDDYHSKGIGVDKTSPRIPVLETSYFADAAKDIDSIDADALAKCIENGETADELDKNTSRAQKKINGGVPHFAFDKFSYDGFLGNWDTTNDYEQVKLLMDAGLTTK